MYIAIIVINNIIINALVNIARNIIDNTPQQVVFGCSMIQTGKPIELTFGLDLFEEELLEDQCKPSRCEWQTFS